jgi:16S rRNA (uracil1498-N3)-methyltransferase
MHRIWTDRALKAGERMDLDKEDTRRMMKVLRLRRGKKVLLFNAQGVEAEAEITDVMSGHARLRILNAEPVRRESPLRIHLVQALPKIDKMAWLIQKATELGVCEVAILLTQRCVPRWIQQREGARLARWRKIALEAARQSGRTEVPEVCEPRKLGEFCQYAASQGGLKLLLKEAGPANGLREVLRCSSAKEIWLVVGPEGGLEEAEAGQLKQAGFQPVRVGPRILRTETAGIALLAVIQYQFGDLT